MSGGPEADLRDEAALVQRFVETYRRKFASIIEQLNQPGSGERDVQLNCLRLCAETLDMMLTTQARLSKSLQALATPASSRRAAA